MTSESEALVHMTGNRKQPFLFSLETDSETLTEQVTFCCSVSLVWWLPFKTYLFISFFLWLNDATSWIKWEYFCASLMKDKKCSCIYFSSSLFVCECPVISIRGMQVFHKRRLFGSNPLNLTDGVNDLENTDPLCRTGLCHSLLLLVINTCMCVWSWRSVSLFTSNLVVNSGENSFSN